MMDSQFFLNRDIDIGMDYRDLQSQLLLQKTMLEIACELLCRVIRPLCTLAVVLFGGTIVSFIAVSGSVAAARIKDCEDAHCSDSDDSESSDADLDLETGEEYIVKYQERYDSLEMRELDKEFLATLTTKFISDKTPDGTIWMNYDAGMEAFTYYINRKNIPYEYLETAGRLYIIENDCKAVFIDYKDEIAKSREQEREKARRREREKARRREREDREDRDREDRDREDRDREDRDRDQDKGEKKSVFASFKTYKSKAAIETKKSEENVLPEKANRYIYKGRILDYDELMPKNNNGNSDEFEHLDYSAFKHGETPLAPHGETPLAPYGETPLAPHGETPLAP